MMCVVSSEVLDLCDGAVLYSMCRAIMCDAMSDVLSSSK